MHRINLHLRPLFFVFAMLWLIANPFESRAQPPVNEPPARSEVMDNMDRLRTAILSRDSIALMTLLSADVTYGHSNGLIQSKADVLRSIMSGQHDYRKIDTKKMDIRVFEGTAVVNMQADVFLLVEGKPLEMDMNILLVWIRRDGTWQLVARQSARNG